MEKGFVIFAKLVFFRKETRKMYRKTSPN